MGADKVKAGGHYDLLPELYLQSVIKNITKLKCGCADAFYALL